MKIKKRKGIKVEEVEKGQRVKRRNTERGVKRREECGEGNKKE